MSERSAGHLALPTRRSTVRLARCVAERLGPGDLLLLDGPLGAGKTFFARALLRALGVPASEPVTSPTFGLVHEHAVGFGSVLHADLYRLADDPGSVARLGLREQRREGALVVVEWGAAHAALLGPVSLRVGLQRHEPQRSAELDGPLADAVLGALGPW